MKSVHLHFLSRTSASLIGLLVLAAMPTVHGQQIAQSPNGSSLVADAYPKLQGYDAQFPAMGSTFAISIYGRNEEEVANAIEDVQAEVERLNLIFSDYDPHSELERWLASDDPAQVELSPELYEILVECDRWYGITAGAFDASVGKLTELWRRARQEKRTPSQDEVTDALTHVGWDKIHIDTQTRRVAIDDQELQIDLGGIATGYTVDRCAKMLTDRGFKHFLINSGGDIRCQLPPPDRRGWTIELAAIEKQGAPIGYLVVHNQSVTTSGDLWRFVEVEGVRLSHIVDPRTGYGIPGPMSVTVISDSCLTVDVLGTALSVMGEEQGLKFLAENFAGLVEAYFVRRDAVSHELRTQKTPMFPDPLSKPDVENE